MVVRVGQPAFPSHFTPLFGQAAAPAATKVHKIPFNGTIVAVDTAAGTVTLNGKMGRVLHITGSTVVIDGSGNPATLGAATVGEEVGGSYIKDAAGTLTASKLRIGAKTGSKAAAMTSAPVATTPPAPAAPTMPAQTAAPDPATASKPVAAPAAAAGKKTRFSGTVTAVDASAGTLTIKTRTFAVTPASKVTGAAGAAATLADVAVGTKVSGSYEKNADGTMTVDTLKIAK